jgi:hypothetical protein
MKNYLPKSQTQAYLDGKYINGGRMDIKNITLKEYTIEGETFYDAKQIQELIGQVEYRKMECEVTTLQYVQ